MEFKLIVKKINNTLNEEEKAIFDAWYHESREHRAYFNRVRENYLEGLDVVDIQKGWDKVSSNIGTKRKNTKYWRYAAAMATLLILGSIPFVLDSTSKSPEVNTDWPIESDPIQIGTDKAVLTLEDGSNVALEKGKSFKTDIASSNGIQLVYSDDTQSSKKTLVYNLLTIPRGGQFFLSLADGTKVWLNSESKLRYPIAFSENGPRTVELVYGEAYFEVSSSQEHDGRNFIVAQQEQEIEVLGTEFNVRAYKEDTVVATTLVEGKVALRKGPMSRELSPGQQSLVNTLTNRVRLVEVDVYNEISWKNGLFSFEDKPLEDIMTVLSRWYDVEVIYANQEIKEMKFNGVFRKSQHIDDILMIIENTNEVNYSINEKTITME